MSEYTYYIIAISDKGILPKREESQAMDRLAQKIFQIRETYLGSLCFTNGFDEKNYIGQRPKEKLLSAEELEQLKDDFSKEKRNLEIFILKEVGKEIQDSQRILVAPG